MCCRYMLEESPELRPIIEAMNRSPLVGKLFSPGAVRSEGEIQPADVAPVLAPDRNGRSAVFPMRWGFSGKSLVFNARLETAASRPMFREAWKSRRCAVPVSCYFEWEHRTAADGKRKTGIKFRLQEDAALTWLCGIYRMEEGVPCFAVLTREPGETIRFIHDRMPLILPESMIPEWIRPDSCPDRLLASARTDLLFRPAV